MNQEIQVSSNAETPAQNPIVGMLPIFAIFAIFYFFVIRPQSKKAKVENIMRDNLQIGNKIVLSSGIFGTMKDIDTEKGLLSIEISSGVNVLVYKTSVAKVLEKEDAPKIAK